MSMVPIMKVLMILTILTQKILRILWLLTKLILQSLWIPMNLLIPKNLTTLMMIPMKIPMLEAATVLEVKMTTRTQDNLPSPMNPLIPTQQPMDTDLNVENVTMMELVSGFLIPIALKNRPNLVNGPICALS